MDETKLPRRQWRRLHRSTYVVTLLAAVVLFFLNVPGQYVPYVGTPLEEDFPFTRLARDRLEHGWPLAYLIRDNRFFVDRPGESDWRDTKTWSFTEDLVSFNAWPLVADCFAAIGLLAVLAAATEYWRRQRRSIWQLRMSDLLGLTAVFAVGIWYGLTTVRDYEQELAAMRKVRLQVAEDGIQYRYPNLSVRTAGGPTWLRDTLEDHFPNVFDRLVYAEVPELDLEQLRTFRQLRAIAVMEKPGPRLASLAQLEQLEAIGVDAYAFLLGVESDDVLDRELAQCLWSFAEMPNLTVFRADGWGVGDRSAKVISGFPRLRVLYLSSTSITDEGMRAVGQCSTVEELYLEYAEISRAALAHLQGLEKLRILDLRACKLADTAFDQLGGFSSLHQLWLSTTDGFRGSDLHKLANLKELESLSLPNDIDPAALADLRRRLPRLKIRIDLMDVPLN